MNQPKKSDSELVAHARRELEMANLFTPNAEQEYDGFLGKGALALVKLFDQWTQGDPQKISAVSNVFDFLIKGDLLSPPTNDPDEWEDYEVEGQTVRRNKRSMFFITRDEGKTWFNLRNKQKGICNDIKTGLPLEGVEDPNGTTEQTAKDQEGSADASDSGDGGHADQSENGLQESGSAPTEDANAEGSEKVEAGELNTGVEPQGQGEETQAESPAEEPQSGEK